MKFTAALASFILSASAAAIDERALTCIIGNREVDTFDDLTAAPAAPELSRVGKYHGLQYNGWVVVDPTALDEVVTAIPILQQLGLGFLGNINLSAVKPQSGDHVAATSLQDDLVQIGNVTLKPMGTMIADRTQGVGAFDPDYFYFSCAFNTGQSLVTPSSGCTISVTGFYLNGVQTQTLRFKSTPSSFFAPQMTRANLPLTWIGLQNMTIGIEEADFTPALTIGNIDSFSHCNRPIIVSAGHGNHYSQHRKATDVAHKHTRTSMHQSWKLR